MVLSAGVCLCQAQETAEQQAQPVAEVSQAQVVEALVTPPATQPAQQTGNQGNFSGGVQSQAVPQATQAAGSQPAATQPAAQPLAEIAAAPANTGEEVLYTLGPEDVLQVTVQRHPEFSGEFPVNLEGKIQYTYVGDILVTGMTKKQLEERIIQLIKRYVANPIVTVTIVDFRSKFVFVIGEVARPGKYYLRSETTTIRDAAIMAGLPTIAAAIRKVQVITPDAKKPKKKKVNLYAVLYGGDLRHNKEMQSGDVLYVPSTVMAKVFRTIAPITEPVTSAAEAQTGITTLNTRPANPRPRTSGN